MKYWADLDVLSMAKIIHWDDRRNGQASVNMTARKTSRRLTVRHVGLVNYSVLGHVRGFRSAMLSPTDSRFPNAITPLSM